MAEFEPASDPPWGGHERLAYRAGYCDLLEEEVHALRQQIAFLKDVADGARPITSPRACLEVGGATPAAKLGPPRGQDSPLQASRVPWPSTLPQDSASTEILHLC